MIMVGCSSPSYLSDGQIREGRVLEHGLETGR